MKTLFFLVPLLLSGELQAAQTTRTLDELIQIVSEKGESGTLGAQAAKMFGIEKDTPTKELWFDQGVVSDGYEYVFALLYSGDKPSGIILTHSKMTEAAGKKTLEGVKHYIDLKGKPRAVITYNGVVGSLPHKTLTSKEAKARVGKELTFWTKESPKYEWSK